MNILDAHLHFFALQAGNYNWLKPENPPYWEDKAIIARTTGESDLRMGTGNRLAGYVHIEAGFDNERPWREIHYLEAHCALPFKAVASINLLDPQALSHIDKLRQFPSVVGLRHILDDSAVSLLSQPKVKHALAYCGQNGLSFDAQLDVCDSNAIRALLNLLDLAPHLCVILNHAGRLFPANSKVLAMHRWRANMRALAQCQRVAVKLSGWEMQQREWHWRHLVPVIEDTVAIFGAQRVMLGSNFPLSNWTYRYHRLWEQYRQGISHLPYDIQRGLLAQNAIDWYRVAAQC